MRGRYTFVFALSFLFGCASALQPLSPNTDIDLEPTHGFVLFAVDSEIEFEEVLIGGKKRMVLEDEDFEGRRFFLASLPAGRYRFRKIVYKDTSTSRYRSLWSRRTIKMSEKDGVDWGFDVQAGKTSYVGELHVEKIEKVEILIIGNCTARPTRTQTNMYLVNRASVAYAHMKENHPILLSKYPVEYNGFGTDRFFVKIRELEKQAAHVTEIPDE